MSSSTIPSHAEIPPPAVREVSDGIFAYAESRGEPRGTPMNYLQMFEEMLIYNGGKLLRCFA